jgi:hypothetical protein
MLARHPAKAATDTFVPFLVISGHFGEPDSPPYPQKAGIRQPGWTLPVIQ